MPTSKKTKTSKKSARTSIKKTSKKVAEKSRQLVDDVMVKVSPAMQKRVDQLIETLQNTKEARIGDLKWLGGQILLRSKVVSDQLKAIRVPMTKAKVSKVSPKKTTSKKTSKKSSSKK